MAEVMEDGNAKSGNDNPPLSQHHGYSHDPKEAHNAKMAEPMEDGNVKSCGDNPHLSQHHGYSHYSIKDRNAKSGGGKPPISQHHRSAVFRDAPPSLSSANPENEARPSAGEVELSLNPRAQPRSEKVDVKGKGPALSAIPERLKTILRKESVIERETLQPEAEHIITIRNADQRMCRSCGIDNDSDEENEENESDNRLIKLGCRCRGSMSRMHRKCILQWFGPRIIWENEFHCEICKGIVHPRITFILHNVLNGRDSGLDILQTALSQTRPTQLLVRAVRQTRPRDTAESSRNVHRIVIASTPPRQEARVLPQRSCLGCAITWERLIGLMFFVMLVLLTLSLYIHKIPPP